MATLRRRFESLRPWPWYDGPGSEVQAAYDEALAALTEGANNGGATANFGCCLSMTGSRVSDRCRGELSAASGLLVALSDRGRGSVPRPISVRPSG